MSAGSPMQMAIWATLNHLIAQQPGANAKLQLYAGKILRLRSGPLELVAHISDAGTFVAAASDALADATLRVGFNSLLCPRDPANFTSVHIEGDQTLATDVGRVLQNLSWDFEDDLSRVIGDVPARLMADRARALDAWGRRALTSLAHNFAEYWTYEAPLIAHSIQVEEYIAQVSEVRDAVERMEKRVERLTKT